MVKRTTESKVIVIPNENTLPGVPIFESEVTDTIRHGERLKEFSDQNKLGLTYRTIGLDENDHNGFVWGNAMCSLGHMILQIDEDVVIYIPEIITPNQIKWYRENFKKEIKDEKRVHAMSLRLSDVDYLVKEITSTKYGKETIKVIDREITMKSLLSSLKSRREELGTPRK